MDHNVAGRALRAARRVLVYGTCVRDEHPDIYEQLSRGRVALAACLEREHFNMVALKLASMLARVKLEELVVLTVDGSPHCVQLHMAVEEAVKVTGLAGRLKVRHLVIESGEVIEIPEACVKVARYLSRVKRLWESARSPSSASRAAQR